MGTNIIQVEKPISNGRYRQVYIHPEDEDKLIKVELPVEQTQSKPVPAFQRARRAVRSLLSKNYLLTGHERELLGIAELHRKDILNHEFFVKYYGEIQTNKGRGLVFQRITNFYNNRIYKLSDYLNEYGYIRDDNLRHNIESYFEFLLNHNIYIYGGQKENIAVIRDVSGKLSIKAFDFKLYTRKALIKIGSNDSYAKMNIKIQKRIALGE